MDYNATQMAQDLNLAQQDYNYLMGMSGVLFGVVLMFALLGLARLKK